MMVNFYQRYSKTKATRVKMFNFLLLSNGCIILFEMQLIVSEDSPPVIIEGTNLSCHQHLKFYHGFLSLALSRTPSIAGPF